MNKIEFNRLNLQDILTEINKQIVVTEAPKKYTISFEKITFARPSYLTATLKVVAKGKNFKVKVPFDYTEKEVRAFMDVETEKHYKFKQRNDVPICSDSYEEELKFAFSDEFEDTLVTIAGDEIDENAIDLYNPVFNVFSFR